MALAPSHRPSFLHSMTLLPEGFILVFGGNAHNDTTVSSGSQCYSDNLLAYDMCKCGTCILGYDMCKCGTCVLCYDMCKCGTCILGSRLSVID